MSAAQRNATRIADAAPLSPRRALILGSGLGGLADVLEEPAVIPYGELEGFPGTGVSGHAGRLAIGRLEGTPAAVLSGRAHYYEQGAAAIMRPVIETLFEAGIQELLLTNAAGALYEHMPPGDLMMVSDHINWSGANPLIGEPTDRRFVPMTDAYDPAIRSRLRACAEGQGIGLHEGVYAWFSGPSFETPAEIRAVRMLGAHAVGMSTVPEVILGRFFGLKCAAVSIITNFAAGMEGAEISHADTKARAPEGGAKLAAILKAYMKETAT